LRPDRKTKLGLAALVGALLTLCPPVARASSPYLVSLPDEALAASAAHRYANLSDEEVLAELDRRALPYELAGETGGVRTPVRLTGPLHGVDVHSALPAEQRAASNFEILDARLALSLDDFCALLERHDIVELVHYTMYRPNGPAPGEEVRIAKKTRDGDKTVENKSTKSRKTAKARTSKKAGKTKGKTRQKGKRADRASLGKGDLSGSSGKERASAEARDSKQKAGATKKSRTKKGNAPSKRTRAKKSGKTKSAQARPSKMKRMKKVLWAPPGTRHPAGLAIDVGAFRKRDGRWLLVGHHFHGRIGARTCGPTVQAPNTPEAQELRAIVCEAYDLGLFTYVLTPNYDRAHADHFHMEIRGDVPWVLFH
jgi:hypothetical protein